MLIDDGTKSLLVAFEPGDRLPLVGDLLGQLLERAFPASPFFLESQPAFAFIFGDLRQFILLLLRLLLKGGQFRPTILELADTSLRSCG